MAHVEFFGPPGAGKSTIFSRLVSSDGFYGGTKQDAVRRIYLENTGLKYRLPYWITPSVIQRFFEDMFMQYRVGQSALEDFIRDYPDFIHILSVAMNSVSYEPEKIFSLCRRSAEQYQLGISTVSETETLCIDEGFIQRSFSILWRQPDELFSLDDYFNNIPIPNLVIYIDAPLETCIERQQRRKRITVNKDWTNKNNRQIQKKTQKLCSDIDEYLNDRTSIIKIENSGSIDKKVEKIISKASKLNKL